MLIPALHRLVVRDIMIHPGDFISAHDEASARQHLLENPGIDHIPVAASGQPTHVFDRNTNLIRQIDFSLLISDSTSIVNLPRLFSQTNQFFFVIEGQSIVGLVHVSDLNAPICKIPYFIIFEALEQAIIARLPSVCDKKNLEYVFPKEATQIIKLIKNLNKSELLPSEFAALSFSQLLRYSCAIELLSLAESSKKDLIDVRNRIAHAGRPLIGKLNNLTTLKNVDAAAELLQHQLSIASSTSK